MSALPQIIIQPGAFRQIPQKIGKLGRLFMILTDAHVRSKGEELLKLMREAGHTANLLVIPAGENSKSLSMVEKIIREAVKLGAKRDSCLLGLGGGVVGDMTGFIASIFMRGVPLVLIPTTLLAMADSSIGGKTGLDLPEGKNLIGTFQHPKLIIMDPLLLKSLPERDFRNGLAEIVKHAVIADKKLFDYLARNAGKILRREVATLKKILQASARIKLSVVQRDMKEDLGKAQKGPSRMLLNYGHTVGHALELLSGYQMPHGEAVAIGMVAENRVAVGKKLLKESEAERIQELLKVFHLPTRIPAAYSHSAIKHAMGMDKKNIDGKLYFALPLRIGAARVKAL